jgi:hypothetical protein
MEKDTTICFQTTPDIRDAIEGMAEKEKRCVSEVIESILNEHLKGNKALKCVSQNRRRSERKPVFLPAFIGDPRWQRRDFIAATIQDISFGGIRVSIPKGTRVKIDNYGNEAQFSVIFSVPDTLWPIHMECRPKWIADSEESLQLGAAIVNPDLNVYKVIQKYLT